MPWRQDVKPPPESSARIVNSCPSHLDPIDGTVGPRQCRPVGLLSPSPRLGWTGRMGDRWPGRGHAVWPTGLAP